MSETNEQSGFPDNDVGAIDPLSATREEPAVQSARISSEAGIEMGGNGQTELQRMRTRSEELDALHESLEQRSALLDQREAAIAWDIEQFAAQRTAAAQKADDARAQAAEDQVALQAFRNEVERREEAIKQREIDAAYLDKAVSERAAELDRREEALDRAQDALMEERAAAEHEIALAEADITERLQHLVVGEESLVAQETALAEAESHALAEADAKLKKRTLWLSIVAGAALVALILSVAGVF